MNSTARTAPGFLFGTPVRILSVALGINLTLSAVKIGWGHRIHSVGMLADGYHSLLDSLSDLLCLLGSAAAKRPPDSDHPYGHFKYESLTQVAVGVLLFLTGYEVLSHSYDQFLHHKTPLVTYASILVMLGSIALQTLLYLGESRVATHSGDTLVAADAAHIKSDLLASGSVILGLFLSWKGFPAADPVIGVLIAAIIGYTGYHLLREGAQVLSDHSPLPLHNVVSLVLETPGVVDCHNVRARGSRNRITMDLNVHVPRNMTVLSAHEIAHRIETRIRDRYPAVVEVIVHIEPDQEESHEPVNP
jgi:cation diffusion facilitator family transporter